MRAVILTILITTILGGCVSSKLPQPDWIAGASGEFPSTDYLLGRGQANSQEDAKDRARADIAKVFQVTMTVASNDVQSFTTHSTNDPSADNPTEKDHLANRSAGIFEGSYSRRITAHTEQVVRGIQIVEQWQDPATRSYHALAILPRAQAATSFRQELDELDRATALHIDHAQSSQDLFLKIAAASLALESQQAREAVQKSLQIVDVSGRGISSNLNSAQLKSNLGSLLQRVKLAPDIAADVPQGFAEIINGALAHAGYLLEEKKQAEFIVRARINLSDLGQQGGWYWQRGNLEITLIEAASGRVRGTKSWLIKSSAPDKASAIKRALGHAETVLKNELGQAIINMAIGKI
mgnify:FL=1